MKRKAISLEGQLPYDRLAQQRSKQMAPTAVAIPSTTESQAPAFGRDVDNSGNQPSNISLSSNQRIPLSNDRTLPSKKHTLPNNQSTLLGIQGSMLPSNQSSSSPSYPRSTSMSQPRSLSPSPVSSQSSSQYSYQSLHPVTGNSKEHWVYSQQIQSTHQNSGDAKNFSNPSTVLNQPVGQQSFLPTPDSNSLTTSQPRVEPVGQPMQISNPNSLAVQLPLPGDSSSPITCNLKNHRTVNSGVSSGEKRPLGQLNTNGWNDSINNMNCNTYEIVPERGGDDSKGIHPSREDSPSLTGVSTISASNHNNIEIEGPNQSTTQRANQSAFQGENQKTVQGSESSIQIGGEYSTSYSQSTNSSDGCNDSDNDSLHRSSPSTGFRARSGRYARQTPLVPRSSMKVELPELSISPMQDVDKDSLFEMLRVLSEDAHAPTEDLLEGECYYEEIAMNNPPFKASCDPVQNNEIIEGDAHKFVPNPMVGASFERHQTNAYEGHSQSRDTSQFADHMGQKCGGEAGSPFHPSTSTFSGHIDMRQNIFEENQQTRASSNTNLIHQPNHAQMQDVNEGNRGYTEGESYSQFIDDMEFMNFDEEEEFLGVDEEMYIDHEPEYSIGEEYLNALPAVEELDESVESEKIIRSIYDRACSDIGECPTEEAFIDGSLEVVIDYVKQVKGIPDLYPWQKDVLSMPEIKTRGNILYSVPTSGGKSVPAEVMILHCVRHRKKSALLILPYVSLVNEKYEDFMDYDYDELDIDLYFANRGIIPPLEGARLMISTIEKAVPLTNALVESERLEELGLIVIDEFHLIGENRGVHLESLLSKLVFLKKKGLHHLSPQIIGMSATFPNMPTLAEWIMGSYYESNFRPVPLKEHVVEVGRNEAIVFDVEDKGEKGSSRKLKSTDALLELILETLDMNVSALVFCPSRQGTESLCQQMAKQLYQYRSKRLPSTEGNSSGNMTSGVGAQMTLETSSEIPLETPLDSSLEALEILGNKFPTESIKMGMCYHHAGLKKDDREAVETCFKEKLIKILFCTSTLAAGVNLPAARVIICSSKIGRENLKKSQYKQMCGRAGRAGYDVFGESFLLLRSNEIHSGWRMIKQEILQLASSFTPDAIKKLVMETCTTIMQSPSDVSLLASCTLFSFLSQTCDGVSSLALFSSAIQDLKNNQLIVENENVEESQLCDTQRTDISETIDEKQEKTTKPSLFSLQKKGRAIALSAFGVKEASSIVDELESLQNNGLILSDSLHILYYMTPREPVLYMTSAMWKKFFDMVNLDLSGYRRKIMRLVGIDDVYIFSASMDSSEASKDKEKLSTHIRFYSACILQDLIQEKEVVKKFCLENQSSKLDQLREQAAYFGAMSLRLCEIMEWVSLAALLKVYAPRVAEGCREELLSMLEVEGIGRKRARMLHRIGISSPEQLAQAKKSYIISKLGSKIAPRYKKTDIFVEKLIGNAKKFLMRKARELRRQMEKVEMSAIDAGSTMIYDRDL